MYLRHPAWPCAGSRQRVLAIGGLGRDRPKDFQGGKGQVARGGEGEEDQRKQDSLRAAKMPGHGLTGPKGLDPSPHDHCHQRSHNEDQGILPDRKGKVTAKQSHDRPRPAASGAIQPREFMEPALGPHPCNGRSSEKDDDKRTSERLALSHAQTQPRPNSGPTVMNTVYRMRRTKSAIPQLAKELASLAFLFASSVRPAITRPST